MANSSSEAEPNATSKSGQQDGDPIAPERDTQQPAAEGSLWGEWTPAGSATFDPQPNRHVRAKLIAGGALAGGGALALIRQRRLAGAKHQGHKRRSLIPKRLRHPEQRRAPSRTALLRIKLWRR
jgi:hypothetical protein